MSRYILFHSKYSEYCKEFISILNTIDINIQPVCIDNKIIRKRLLLPNNINILYVPCILVIKDDGGIEKYEGEIAFEWISQYIPKNDVIQEDVIQDVIQEDIQQEQGIIQEDVKQDQGIMSAALAMKREREKSLMDEKKSHPNINENAI